MSDILHRDCKRVRPKTYCQILSDSNTTMFVDIEERDGEWIKSDTVVCTVKNV